MEGLNERLLYIIIPYILWLETLLQDIPFMISNIGGELGFFLWSYNNM